MNSQQKYELKEKRRRQKQQNRVGQYAVGKTSWWGEDRRIRSFHNYHDAIAFVMSYAWLCPSTSFQPITVWVLDKDMDELVYSQLCGYRINLCFDPPVEKINWKVEGF